jgi:hypothetical protein
MAIIVGVFITTDAWPAAGAIDLAKTAGSLRHRISTIEIAAGTVPMMIRRHNVAMLVGVVVGSSAGQAGSAISSSSAARCSR